MKINLRVRVSNKNFWVTIIPAVLLLAQYVADLFGFALDLGTVGNKLIAIVDVVFMILATIGVVNDPTTEGFEDSDRAMTYKEPN